MALSLEILEPDSEFRGVVQVEAPGIYGHKGDPLPLSAARLVRPAAVALQKAIAQVLKEGGHLYISDMFRTPAQQQKAHEDWMSGRKSAFSPPSCNSVHEAARAIDIDAFDTGIGHERVREILNASGWTNVVDTLTGPECWHYEFRGAKWEAYKAQHGYAAMARAMKEEIGNTEGRDRADRRAEDVRWLQQRLKELTGIDLKVDGIYGPHTRDAVRTFQEAHGLQVDGIAGPRTLAEIKELEESAPSARKEARSPGST